MIAQILFWDAQNGGRLTPPHSGFHPQIEISGVYTSFWVESLTGVEVFEFGKEYPVLLRPLLAQYNGALKVGDAVKLFEGSKQIGKGVIVDMSR